MLIIHTSSKKSKVKKKPGWKQREAEYEAWLKSHGVDSKAKKKSEPVGTYTQTRDVYRRETRNIPSLPCSFEPCLKKDTNVYTGTMMKGIGTMHKSNAVPIFSDEEAQAIATMRR